VVGGHAEYPAVENNYGRAYAVSLESEGGPDWPMFRRNIIRSACVYDTVSISVPETVIIKPDKSVYYLPSEQKLKIKAKAEGTYNFQIFNFFGQIMIDKYIIHNQIIDISSYPSGVYLYILSAGDGAIEKGKVLKP